MKTRPILFNAEMVRAILAGRKTQTRRVVKRITPDWIQGMDFDICHDPPHIAVHHHGNSYAERIPCPYGAPGDRLWVRETFAAPLAHDGRRPMDIKYVGLDRTYYRASHPADYRPPFNFDAGDFVGRWRPSIHMPRWASRITLEVLSVRVERVQEITKADAIAEGVEWTSLTKLPWLEGGSTPVDAFSNLWDTINAKRGYSWESNPWVWVVEFKAVGD